MGLLFFLTTTNVSDANFPLENGYFHFIDSQTFLDLFLCNSIKN